MSAAKCILSMLPVTSSELSTALAAIFDELIALSAILDACTALTASFAAVTCASAK